MSMLIGALTGGLGGNRGKKVKGKIEVMKKNVLDLVAPASSVIDNGLELLGQKVTVQLISAVHGSPKGKLGKVAEVQSWITQNTPLIAGKTAVLEVHFDWEDDLGLPGAFIIKNYHSSEFFLVSLTIDDVPGHGRVHFDCNSWVYPAFRYKKDRIFFSNKTYLPSETPAPLRPYREEELATLRGDGTGKREEWDRIYDYALYNDLGDPDAIVNSAARPVIGGSSELPYPRRGRTGRPPTRTDPESESRMWKISSLNIYIPRDERFGHLKMADFLAYLLKTIDENIIPMFKALVTMNKNDYDNLKETLELYEGGLQIPGGEVINQLIKAVPLEMLREIIQTDGQGYFKFPMPQVIKEDRLAWRTDEEFTREMLAGVDPVIIRGLQEFPPKSTLDPELYGDHTSTITEEDIKDNLEGLSVEEAIKSNRMFILDHHDAIMPYLSRINSTSTKTYATRTLLFLKDDGTLKPLAIELSLPRSEGERFGPESKVYTPAESGVKNSIWQLAKAYVVTNDAGYHQLISHWLNTHAVMEPFILATNRQLSVVHPIFKLLQPHYRDTMNINAFARQFLVNAGGIVESVIFTSKYSMEMSSKIYKNWVFTDQALPTDLLKRKMAVEDENSPHGIRLLIEDYPYASDGLEIWSAIKTWVADYCNFYYKSDETVQKDHELQSWWKEVREKGHGDLKNEPWWPKMQTREDLIHSCTIIIWVGSALHAAVNFGQYPYGGYLPNRPTITRRFMPKEGTPAYEELVANPEEVLLKTINAQYETLVNLSVIEVLSRHSSDEIYLGQRDSEEWTVDEGALKAFEKFGKKLAEIEEMITNRNNDKTLKNRNGPVKMPYTLLYPSSEGGITAKGIPNSISI